MTPEKNSLREQEYIKENSAMNVIKVLVNSQFMSSYSPASTENLGSCVHVIFKRHPYTFSIHRPSSQTNLLKRCFLVRKNKKKKVA